MRSISPSRPGQSGFTLIELMVGVVLGMIAIVAIAQVLTVSEGRKRTTTAGADAQISGALGIYALQREVQMAGYGVSANPAGLGCTVNYKSGSNAASAFTLAPVVIGAGANGSNTITVLRSTKSSFSVPIRVTENHPNDGTSFVVQSSVGVLANDLMIAVPPTPGGAASCSVIQVFADASKPLTSSSVPHVSSASASWNPALAASLLPAGGYDSGSYLLNVGSLSLRRYSVDTTAQTLQFTELNRDAGAWTSAQDIQPQVVMLKAMYGKDTNADGAVDAYNAVQPTTAAEWAQVISVRIMVVARSANFEKVDTDNATLPTTGPLEWDVGTSDITVAGATACHTDHLCISVPLTSVGSDWQHYRYKLYDTVIPLRNILWNS